MLQDYEAFIPRTKPSQRRSQGQAASTEQQPCGSFVNMIDFCISPESWVDPVRVKEERVMIKKKRGMKRDSHLHRHDKSNQSRMDLPRLPERKMKTGWKDDVFQECIPKKKKSGMTFLFF